MTMRHAEEELVTLLRDRVEHAPASPDRGARAAALGRTILRRRRARGTALASGAMALAVAAGVGVSGWPGGQARPANTAPAGTVPVAVRLPAEVPLPRKAGHFFRDEKLPLVDAYQNERMGERVSVSFTALSTDTLYNVRCAVPDSWLAVQIDSPGGAASIGRCGPHDHMAQFDAQSAGSQWVGRRHTWTVWVLPPEAGITGETDPSDVPAIAARTGVRPGAWSIGFYDERR